MPSRPSRSARRAALQAARLNRLRALAAGPVVLTVVVGWGRNSPAGVARLLPAVTAWLRRRGVPYGEDETNPGLVHVFLGRR